MKNCLTLAYSYFRKALLAKRSHFLEILKNIALIHSWVRALSEISSVQSWVRMRKAYWWYRQHQDAHYIYKQGKFFHSMLSSGRHQEELLQGYFIELGPPNTSHTLQAEKILETACTDSQKPFQSHCFSQEKQGGLLEKKAGGLTSIPTLTWDFPAMNLANTYPTQVCWGRKGSTHNSNLMNREKEF